MVQIQADEVLEFSKFLWYGTHQVIHVQFSAQSQTNSHFHTSHPYFICHTIETIQIPVTVLTDTGDAPASLALQPNGQTVLHVPGLCSTLDAE